MTSAFQSSLMAFRCWGPVIIRESQHARHLGRFVHRKGANTPTRPYTYAQTLPAIITFRLRQGGGPYILKTPFFGEPRIQRANGLPVHLVDNSATDHRPKPALR
jgi:hypothetical protein